MGSAFIRIGEIREIGEPPVRGQLNWVLLLGVAWCVLFWLAVVAGVAALL